MVEKIIWFIGIVAVLALSRIIPHPPNFTPIIAVAIFAPIIVKNHILVITTTLSAMFVADLYWGLHSFMFWTYSSIALCTLIATRFHTMYMMLIGPVIFFVITNFAVWTSGYYGFTLAGLVACYIAAIPFFHMTLLSTILYTSAFYIIRQASLRLLQYR